MNGTNPGSKWWAFICMMVLFCFLRGVVQAGEEVGEAGGAGGVVVKFVVEVPREIPKAEKKLPGAGAGVASLPGVGGVYVSGNGEALGSWSGKGLELTRGGDGLWRGEAVLPKGSAMQFKLTRGSWATVEKNADGTERANRTHEVTGTAVLRLAVARWQTTAEAKAQAAKQAQRQPTVVGDLRLHKVESHPPPPPPPEVQEEHPEVEGELPRAGVASLPGAGAGVGGRTVRVWLPAGYEDAANAGRRYPVFYLQDGQHLFDEVTAGHGGEWRADETATALIAAGKIEPVILVGIDNGGGSARLTGYMSKRVQVREGLVIGGEGEAYMRFVVEAVKPMVDQAYRTKQGAADTAVGGSSLGAVIALELVRDEPEVFGKAAAMSPSLWVDTAGLIDGMAAALPVGGRYWVDMGDAEGDPKNHGVSVAMARRLAMKLEARGAAVRFMQVRGGTHSESAWAARFGGVLEFLFGAEGERK